MISDRTYSVMLADDEPFAREGLKRLIDWEACGFEICGEAADGQEALELIGRLRPDVVVVDLRMPGLDGLELIRTVVEERRLPVRFLIASGYGEFDYARRAMRYGVCDFLTKPVDPDELRDALKNVRRRLEEGRKRPGPAAAEENADTLLWLERLVAVSVAGDAPSPGATAGKTVPRDPSGSAADTDLSADAPAGLDPVCYAIAERNEPWRPGAAGSGVWTKAPSAERTKAGFLRAVERLCGPDVRVISHMPARDRIGFLVEAVHLAVSGLGLREFLTELRRMLVDEWSAPAIVYAGTPVGGLGELVRSVRSAWTTADRAYAFESGGTVFFAPSDACSRTFGNPVDFVRLASTVETRIQAFVEEAETAPADRLPDVVPRLIDELSQIGLDTDAVRQTVYRIIRHFAELVASLGGDAAPLPALREALTGENARRTRADLEAMLADVVREVAACLRRLRRECGLPRAVRAFVDEHYGEPLSLKTVSKRFYVNAAHLGRTFKRAFGLSFGDYVFEIRLREAKKLLRDTDLRVSEIAERVGFRNADYFSSRFFQVMKMSPTEYRNRFRIS